MAREFQQRDAVERFAEGIAAEQLTLKPVMLGLVGKVRGRNVLDVGCGNGRYSELFARAGANVIATDRSKEQIELAKKLHAHPNISYDVGDASIGASAPHLMDVVFANLVVPSTGSVASLNSLFAAARHAVRDDGRFIFSILHPLYISRGQDASDHATDFDPADYYEEGKSYHSNAYTVAGNIMQFEEAHFSLTKISELLRDNGFLISSLVESRQIPNRKIFLPKYLAIECVPKKSELKK